MMSNYQRMRWERQRFDADRRREDNRDTGTAWHEAGHVVCGHLLGLNSSRATIVGGDGYSGKTYFGETTDEVTDHDLAYAPPSFAWPESRPNVYSAGLMMVVKTMLAAPPSPWVRFADRKLRLTA
jgi:hypothetical protein